MDMMYILHMGLHLLTIKKILKIVFQIYLLVIELMRYDLIDGRRAFKCQTGFKSWYGLDLPLSFSERNKHRQTRGPCGRLLARHARPCPGNGGKGRQRLLRQPAHRASQGFGHASHHGHGAVDAANAAIRHRGEQARAARAGHYRHGRRHAQHHRHQCAEQNGPRALKLLK